MVKQQVVSPHVWLTRQAALNIGCREHDIEKLLEYVDFPDTHDNPIDRIWNHGVLMKYNVGGGIAAVDHALRQASVPDNPYQYRKLAYAVHYLQDLGCPVHTIPLNYYLHKLYEGYVVSNWDTITRMIVQPVAMTPYISRSATSLAKRSYKLSGRLLDALAAKNDHEVFMTTAEALENTLSFTSGLLDKFQREVKVIKCPKYL